MKGINSFVIIDFETGGLDCRKNAVTEVTAIAIKGDTLEKIDIVSTFIKPYGDYTYEDAALKATGITFQEIESGVSVKEAVNELIALFKKADLFNSKATKPILIAHNSAFDEGYLTQIFNYCGKMKELEKLVYGKTDFFGNFHTHFLDSIILAKMMWGADEEMSNYKLETCISKAGLELSDAHRSLNDVLGLKDLFGVIINKLRAETGSNAVTAGTKFRDHFQF